MSIFLLSSSIIIGSEFAEDLVVAGSRSVFLPVVFESDSEGAALDMFGARHQVLSWRRRLCLRQLWKPLARRLQLHGRGVAVEQRWLRQVDARSVLPWSWHFLLLLHSYEILEVCLRSESESRSIGKSSGSWLVLSWPRELL